MPLLQSIYNVITTASVKVFGSDPKPVSSSRAFATPQPSGKPITGPSAAIRTLQEVAARRYMSIDMAVKHATAGMPPQATTDILQKVARGGTAFEYRGSTSYINVNGHEYDLRKQDAEGFLLAYSHAAHVINYMLMTTGFLKIGDNGDPNVYYYSDSAASAVENLWKARGTKEEYDAWKARGSKFDAQTLALLSDAFADHVEHAERRIDDLASKKVAYLSLSDLYVAEFYSVGADGKPHKVVVAANNDPLIAAASQIRQNGNPSYPIRDTSGKIINYLTPQGVRQIMLPYADWQIEGLGRKVANIQSRINFANSTSVKITNSNILLNQELDSLMDRKTKFDSNTSSADIEAMLRETDALMPVISNGNTKLNGAMFNPNDFSDNLFKTTDQILGDTAGDDKKRELLAQALEERLTFLSTFKSEAAKEIISKLAELETRLGIAPKGDLIERMNQLKSAYGRLTEQKKYDLAKQLFLSDSSILSPEDRTLAYQRLSLLEAGGLKYSIWQESRNAQRKAITSDYTGKISVGWQGSFKMNDGSFYTGYRLDVDEQGKVKAFSKDNPPAASTDPILNYAFTLLSRSGELEHALNMDDFSKFISGNGGVLDYSTLSMLFGLCDKRDKQAQNYSQFISEPKHYNYFLYSAISNGLPGVFAELAGSALTNAGIGTKALFGEDLEAQLNAKYGVPAGDKEKARADLIKGIQDGYKELQNGGKFVIRFPKGGEGAPVLYKVSSGGALEPVGGGDNSDYMLPFQIALRDIYGKTGVESFSDGGVFMQFAMNLSSAANLPQMQAILLMPKAVEFLGAAGVDTGSTGIDAIINWYKLSKKEMNGEALSTPQKEALQKLQTNLGSLSEDKKAEIQQVIVALGGSGLSSAELISIFNVSKTNSSDVYLLVNGETYNTLTKLYARLNMREENLYSLTINSPILRNYNSQDPNNPDPLLVLKYYLSKIKGTDGNNLKINFTTAFDQGTVDGLRQIYGGLPGDSDKLLKESIEEARKLEKGAGRPAWLPTYRKEASSRIFTVSRTGRVMEEMPFRSSSFRIERPALSHLPTPLSRTEVDFATSNRLGIENYSDMATILMSDPIFAFNVLLYKFGGGPIPVNKKGKELYGNSAIGIGELDAFKIWLNQNQDVFSSRTELRQSEIEAIDKVKTYMQEYELGGQGIGVIVSLQPVSPKLMDPNYDTLSPEIKARVDEMVKNINIVIGLVSRTIDVASRVVVETGGRYYQRKMEDQSFHRERGMINEGGSTTYDVVDSAWNLPGAAVGKQINQVEDWRIVSIRQEMSANGRNWSDDYIASTGIDHRFLEALQKDFSGMFGMSIPMLIFGSGKGDELPHLSATAVNSLLNNVINDMRISGKAWKSLNINLTDDPETIRAKIIIQNIILIATETRSRQIDEAGLKMIAKQRFMGSAAIDWGRQLKTGLVINRLLTASKVTLKDGTINYETIKATRLMYERLIKKWGDKSPDERDKLARDKLAVMSPEERDKLALELSESFSIPHYKKDNSPGQDLMDMLARYQSVLNNVKPESFKEFKLDSGSSSTDLEMALEVMARITAGGSEGSQENVNFGIILKEIIRNNKFGDVNGIVVNHYDSEHPVWQRIEQGFFNDSRKVAAYDGISTWGNFKYVMPVYLNLELQAGFIYKAQYWGTRWLENKIKGVEDPIALKEFKRACEEEGLAYAGFLAFMYNPMAWIETGVSLIVNGHPVYGVAELVVTYKFIKGVTMGLLGKSKGWYTTARNKTLEGVFGRQYEAGYEKPLDSLPKLFSEDPSVAGYHKKSLTESARIAAVKGIDGVQGAAGKVTMEITGLPWQLASDGVGAVKSRIVFRDWLSMGETPLLSDSFWASGIFENPEGKITFSVKANIDLQALGARGIHGRLAAWMVGQGDIFQVDSKTALELVRAKTRGEVYRAVQNLTSATSGRKLTSKEAQNLRSRIVDGFEEFKFNALLKKVGCSGERFLEITSSRIRMENDPKLTASEKELMRKVIRNIDRPLEELDLNGRDEVYAARVRETFISDVFPENVSALFPEFSQQLAQARKKMPPDEFIRGALKAHNESLLRWKDFFKDVFNGDPSGKVAIHILSPLDNKTPLKFAISRRALIGTMSSALEGQMDPDFVFGINWSKVNRLGGQTKADKLASQSRTELIETNPGSAAVINTIIEQQARIGFVEENAARLGIKSFSAYSSELMAVGREPTMGSYLADVPEARDAYNSAEATGYLNKILPKAREEFYRGRIGQSYLQRYTGAENWRDLISGKGEKAVELMKDSIWRKKEPAMRLMGKWRQVQRTTPITKVYEAKAAEKAAKALGGVRGKQKAIGESKILPAPEPAPQKPELPKTGTYDDYLSLPSSTGSMALQKLTEGEFATGEEFLAFHDYLARHGISSEDVYTVGGDKSHLSVETLKVALKETEFMDLNGGTGGRKFLLLDRMQPGEIKIYAGVNGVGPMSYEEIMVKIPKPIVVKTGLPSIKVVSNIGGKAAPANDYNPMAVENTGKFTTTKPSELNKPPLKLVVNNENNVLRERSNGNNPKAEPVTLKPAETGAFTDVAKSSWVVIPLSLASGIGNAWSNGEPMTEWGTWKGILEDTGIGTAAGLSFTGGDVALQRLAGLSSMKSLPLVGSVLSGGISLYGNRDRIWNGNNWTKIRGLGNVGLDAFNGAVSAIVFHVGGGIAGLLGIETGPGAFAIGTVGGLASSTLAYVGLSKVEDEIAKGTGMTGFFDDKELGSAFQRNGVDLKIANQEAVYLPAPGASYIPKKPINMALSVASPENNARMYVDRFAENNNSVMTVFALMGMKDDKRSDADLEKQAAGNDKKALEARQILMSRLLKNEMRKSGIVDMRIADINDISLELLEGVTSLTKSQEFKNMFGSSKVKVQVSEPVCKSYSDALTAEYKVIIQDASGKRQKEFKVEVVLDAKKGGER